MVDVRAFVVVGLLLLFVSGAVSQMNSYACVHKACDGYVRTRGNHIPINNQWWSPFDVAAYNACLLHYSNEFLIKEYGRSPIPSW